jgi:hypothetical protein
MILHRSGVGAPSLDRVAILTLRTKLPLVEIGMAVRTSRTSFREDFTKVARITGHVLVQSAQREVSVVVVIELWLGAQRRPTRRCMTVLARD